MVAGPKVIEPEKGFYLLRVFKDRNNQNKRAEQWAAITQDIETARAILAKAKQETKNQNSFRGSRRTSNVGSFRSDIKPRSSGILNHFGKNRFCWKHPQTTWFQSVKVPPSLAPRPTLLHPTLVLRIVVYQQKAISYKMTHSLWLTPYLI